MKAIGSAAVLALVFLPAGFAAPPSAAADNAKLKVSAKIGSLNSGAASTYVTFKRIEVGETVMRDVACTIGATMKCSRVVNGKKTTCESSKMKHADIKKMGFAVIILLPTAGAVAAAACFGK